MKIYQVTWVFDRTRRWGFVKADSEEQAIEILVAKTQDLTYGHKVVGEVSENWISPQSICLNFENTATYQSF